MGTSIVIGAGIMGVTTALELRRRNHQVTLLDPGPIPHPLAASSDISKAVRATYGADEVYTELAERSIRRWREWNDQLGEKLYHETGVMFLCREEMQPGSFEFESYKLLKQRGHQVERIKPERLRERFPAWDANRYQDGVFDPEGGYAESGRVVTRLVARAREEGVQLREHAEVEQLAESGQKIEGVVLKGGERLRADFVIAATGAWTPYLFPWTQPFFRATAHPIFHLKPRRLELFAPECFPMFGADISETGYYGFPIGREGVLKIGSHGPGREMSPDSTDRTVSADELAGLRSFLAENFPMLKDADIVYSRLCLYSDTADGDFWIARDPDRPGLTIASGDSGHGFKFAPVLGEIAADAAEGKSSPLLHKFRWRPEIKAGQTKEAARYLRERVRGQSADSTPH